jgi:L-alanine-DL-glutamate epimerase-like enolase superfamily enzyme
MTTRRNPTAPTTRTTRTTRTTIQRLQLALAYVPLKNPTSVLEHWRLLEAGAADILQPDAPRVGGITPFNQIAALAHHKGVPLAPHFAMELHLHLAAAQSRETWVEHFDWLEPLFNERLALHEGRMLVPDRPGLGLTLSDHAQAWTTQHWES